jgi:Derlin-2/3
MLRRADVCRVLLLATVSLSILVHAKLVRGYMWTFEPRAILLMPPEIPQIWRMLSSFCIARGGIYLLFDAYFCESPSDSRRGSDGLVYTYSSRLEHGAPRFSEYGSYFVYIAFIMAVIQVRVRT